MVLEGVKLLIGPDIPVWLKALVGLLFIGALVIWWNEPYWHSLQKPDKDISPREARPPFEL